MLAAVCSYESVSEAVAATPSTSSVPVPVAKPRLKVISPDTYLTPAVVAEAPVTCSSRAPLALR